MENSKKDNVLAAIREVNAIGRDLGHQTGFHRIQATGVGEKEEWTVSWFAEWHHIVPMVRGTHTDLATAFEIVVMKLKEMGVTQQNLQSRR